MQNSDKNAKWKGPSGFDGVEIEREFISEAQYKLEFEEIINSKAVLEKRLGINIVAAPNVTQVASPLISCATGFNGIATFNLELSDFEILDRVQSNLTINYFNDLSDINQADGLDNSNEIILPSSFNSVSKTVYIKIANTLTSCFTVIPLELITNTPPVFNTIETIPICDNDTGTFDLSLVDNMVVEIIFSE